MVLGPSSVMTRTKRLLLTPSLSHWLNGSQCVVLHSLYPKPEPREMEDTKTREVPRYSSSSYSMKYRHWKVPRGVVILPSPVDLSTTATNEVLFSVLPIVRPCRAPTSPPERWVKFRLWSEPVLEPLRIGEEEVLPRILPLLEQGITHIVSNTTVVTTITT